MGAIVFLEVIVIKDKLPFVIHILALLESKDKEVMYMWIIVGYVLCVVSRTTGRWKLYTAARHSFRSDRPGLFMQYWRSV